MKYLVLKPNELKTIGFGSKILLRLFFLYFLFRFFKEYKSIPHPVPGMGSKKVTGQHHGHRRRPLSVEHKKIAAESDCRLDTIVDTDLTTPDNRN